MINLRFKKLNEDAVLPEEKDLHDAGLDIYSLEEKTIFAGRTEAFSTGLSLEMEWDMKDAIEDFHSPEYNKQYYDSVNKDFSYAINQWLMENMTPYLKLESRSGMSTKGINVGAGVIDYGYRGEIKVVLHNVSQVPYQVKKGDKIAQAIVRFKPAIDIELAENLSESDRGDGGFGSTGA